MYHNVNVVLVDSDVNVFASFVLVIVGPEWVPTLPLLFLFPFPFPFPFSFPSDSKLA